MSGSFCQTISHEPIVELLFDSYFCDNSQASSEALAALSREATNAQEQQELLHAAEPVPVTSSDPVPIANPSPNADPVPSADSEPPLIRRTSQKPRPTALVQSDYIQHPAGIEAFHQG